MKKTKYYDLSEILKHNAHYNIIFGERSNGKTYAVLKYGVEQYFKNGKHMGVIRRYQDDLRGKRAQAIFDALVFNGEIEKLSKGKWTKIIYYSQRWYMARYDEELGKDIKDAEPFAYAFSLTTSEREKSTSYPKITTVLFDEFLTRDQYLANEFTIFMNMLSTIVRQREDIKIFMLGNTVNKYCPYFQDMGLNHITKQKKGTIETYTYGDSKLKVAVEYSEFAQKSKPSDVYFAFDNPKLKMITRGEWEIALYPHCPTDYIRENVEYTYYIDFDGNFLQCDIIAKDDLFFTFIHRKKESKDIEETSIVYSVKYDPRPNYRRKLTRPSSDIENKLSYFFRIEKVYYEDNNIGEVVRNYLNWCETDRLG